MKESRKCFLSPVLSLIHFLKMISLWEVPRCSAFCDLTSLSTSSFPRLLSYSLPFCPLSSLLISFTSPPFTSPPHIDSLAVTQTTVLLMTYTVFLLHLLRKGQICCIHKHTHTRTHVRTHAHTHTRTHAHTPHTHAAGHNPAGIGGPVWPLLSPCWLLAVIIHSRVETPSIMVAKLPSWPRPITHRTPVNNRQHHCVWLCSVSSTVGAKLLFLWRKTRRLFLKCS